uniref:Uncharacterized protein n=1 Tax=Tanacetum cinerariifolium TaxID=118510 RepID=A0A6L2J338_TANCI|nr:hypothetical protein [Tanacetum cinerariifolium]
MTISDVMLNNVIKASANYLEYLAKSTGSVPTKATGKGKGLLTRDRVKFAIKTVSIPKRKRSQTMIEDIGQYEEAIDDDVNLEDTNKEEVEPLVPDVHTLKCINKGAGMTSEVLDEPSDASSSSNSDSDITVEDISSYDDEVTKKLDEVTENTNEVTKKDDEVTVKTSVYTDNADYVPLADGVKLLEQQFRNEEHDASSNADKDSNKRQKKHDYHKDDKDQAGSLKQAKFFFNQDLEYLKTGNLEERKARQANQSDHIVYSRMKILSIVIITVEEYCGYGYLREIVVKRAYQKEYMFKEADFQSLYLNDIKDMFLVHYQNKLHHLNGKIQTHLAVALVVDVVTPTTAEQKLAKRNEFKARGTLLMALPDKHQLKFNIHKDAKSLMEAIKKRNKADLKDQSLDDLFNNLKIYEAEVKSSSSTSHNTQNIAFVSLQNTNNTNESVSAVPSVYVASTKPPASILPNVDNLSDAVIYSFFAKMDLKWQMAMLTMRARRFLQRTGRNLRANGTTSIGFDMSKVECYNCHKRGHFTRDSMIGAFKLMKNHQIMPSWHLPPQVLKVLTVRDNDLVELRKKLETAEKKRDELKHTLEKFQTSLKNPSKLLESQITDKTGLGYDNQMFTSTVFDCDELNSSKSNVSMPTSPVHNRYKSGERYHAVPPPYKGTFMPPKPDSVFHDLVQMWVL